ncbi:MAG: amidohydrolase, partial [Spirochaetes bacterium]
TVGGADHLGRPDLGSLEPGKAADLFMIDAQALELAGAVHDPANLLPRVAVTGPVALTMINGKVVWENGELTGVDERALFHAAEAVSDESIRERIQGPV